MSLQFLLEENPVPTATVEPLFLEKIQDALKMHPESRPYNRMEQVVTLQLVSVGKAIMHNHSKQAEVYVLFNFLSFFIAFHQIRIEVKNEVRIAVLRLFLRKVSSISLYSKIIWITRLQY